MSISAINWAYKVTAAGAAKLVLVTLANYADENDYCYPSQKKLSELTGLGERTVRRHLADLEACGFIRREPRKSNSGQYSSDGFFLLTSQRPNLPTAKSADGQKIPSQRPNLQEPAANLAAYTKEEPKVEPKEISKKATRLEDDWELTDEKKSVAVDVAEKAGISFDNDQEIQLQADLFKDYWLSAPGAKGRKLDWDATWRNWIRRWADGESKRLQRQQQIDQQWQQRMAK